jgi:hypothetical protein
MSGHEQTSYAQTGPLRRLVSLSAGVIVMGAAAVAAVAHSGSTALAEFAVGMAISIGTAIALMAAWGRTLQWAAGFAEADWIVG